MEKKTLGSFIALLRKSRGMTQRELAEKLGVSDKTISHWERDESSPDISLIPVIAEIFDVTCDELLKGEKAEHKEKTAPENNHKQQKYLFEKVYSKFRTQCLVLTGVALVGFIFAFIAYWEWSWNFFLVDSVFFIVSVFGLVIAKMQNKSALLTVDSDEQLSKEYEKKSRELFWYSFIINIVLTCFATVQEIDDGLALFLAVAIGVLLYLILRLTKQISFDEKGKIIEKIIIKTVSVTLALVIAFTGLFFGLPDLLTEINTPDPVHFETMVELKNYMETEKPLPDYALLDTGSNAGYSEETVNGQLVRTFFLHDYPVVKFTWKNFEVQHIEFHQKNGGGYSADVYFYENDVTEPFFDAIYPADAIIFYSYYPIVIISAILICIFKIRKKIK